ncbi:MAG: hypothetical protein AB1778_01485 [Candidatus Bipolaricaulota bacterium]
MARRNRQARVALAWWSILGLSILGGFLPFWLGMDGMDGGFAIAFGCLFVGIVALIAALVFTARSRILARLLAGQGLLVRWTYAPESQQRQATEEAVEERKASWGLLLIIALFAVLIGGGFWIADPEAGRWVFFTMLGVVAILAVVATAAPRYREARRRRAEPLALVSREGAYVLGMLHTWRLLGARVEGGGVSRGRRPTLNFEYSAPVVYGRFFFTRQSYVVSIPIPPGEEERAEEVLQAVIEGVRGDSP